MPGHPTLTVFTLFTQELFLTDNRLRRFPEGFGRLRSLVKLQASFNQLEDIPEELGDLPSLEIMRVRGGVGQKLPWINGSHMVNAIACRLPCATSLGCRAPLGGIMGRTPSRPTQPLLLRPRDGGLWPGLASGATRHPLRLLFQGPSFRHQQCDVNSLLSNPLPVVQLWLRCDLKGSMNSTHENQLNPFPHLSTPFSHTFPQAEPASPRLL